MTITALRHLTRAWAGARILAGFAALPEQPHRGRLPLAVSSRHSDTLDAAR
jgi:hypothetical protein